jgi:hypothetical protein
MAAVLEQVLHDAGIPSISIWAQVPQYIPAMTYPAAAVALLDGLKDTAGLVFDRGSLQQEAVIQTERLDRLVAKNAEHQEMVEKLEQAYDTMAPRPSTDPNAELLSEKDIPTPEELTAELEAFLRDANPDLP